MGRIFVTGAASDIEADVGDEVQVQRAVEDAIEA